MYTIVVMIHLSEPVIMLELETRQVKSMLRHLQVILKSHGQHTYKKERMKSSKRKLMQMHHFRLMFYAANIIFRCI